MRRYDTIRYDTICMIWYDMTIMTISSKNCLSKQREQVSGQCFVCMCSMPRRPGQMSQQRYLYMGSTLLLWRLWWLWRRFWWTSQLQWVIINCLCFLLLSRDTVPIRVSYKQLLQYASNTIHCEQRYMARRAARNAANHTSTDSHTSCLQCFDAVGWAAGRASSL